MVVSMNPTPACPKGFYEHACTVEGVDLVCHLEYIPSEYGSKDSMGLLYEPDTEQSMDLVNAYVAKTDIDIAHLLLQYVVDEITNNALKELQNDR
jgi:hypothetical protein